MIDKTKLFIEMVKVRLVYPGIKTLQIETIYGLALVKIPTEQPTTKNKNQLRFQTKICSMVPRLNSDGLIAEFEIETGSNDKRVTKSKLDLEKVRLEYCEFKKILLKIFMGKKVTEFHRLKGISVPISRISELEDIIQVRLDLRVG
jgi:hypothetical protein